MRALGSSLRPESETWSALAVNLHFAELKCRAWGDDLTVKKTSWLVVEVHESSLLFCCRFKYAVSRRPRTHNPVWRGIHQASGQPPVQRDVCGEGEGRLRPGGEVGGWAHPWEPLPCHGSLKPPRVRRSVRSQLGRRVSLGAVLLQIAVSRYPRHTFQYTQK